MTKVNEDVKLGMSVTTFKERDDTTSTTDAAQPTPELRTFPIKLGWIQGVLIPCLLNIWGVMLFLRISWMVAQAGIMYSLIIIFLSSTVCIITTLSLSAICTNGVVQGGGVYYLVSRSLGAELGASVGIIFAFANSVAASMNTIGFCVSLNELLASYGKKIFDNDVNDIRFVGAIALLVMCLVCAVGMDWETKTQNFLITVIVLAIFNYIIGACVGPLRDEQRAKGFQGIRSDIASQNWVPDYRHSEEKMHNFFSVFAMYFPAVTGVQAGANICGDLRDPATAIPKGTLLAVLISTSSYLTLAVLSGLSTLRDASGKISDLPNLDKIASCKPNCPYGLHNNYEMMQLAALWDLLIYFGCWAATLSTALTNLLAVPRLIQALADLDKIAPLITNFYLASYSLINFCTFHADFVSHLSWRPQFRFYHRYLSLVGFVLCLCIMMIISWMMALATVLLFLTLYLIVHYRKPKANWGSSTEAQQYSQTITYLLSKTSSRAGIKSYNPRLLVLSGKPYSNQGLISFAHLITKNGSFMIAADIELRELSKQERRMRSEIAQTWLNDQKYRAFYVLLDGHETDRGVSALLETTGLGSMAPNILLVGFLEGWEKQGSQAIAMYVRTLRQAFDHNAALTILRMANSLHSVSSKTSSHNILDHKQDETRLDVQTVIHADSEELLAANAPHIESATPKNSTPSSQASNKLVGYGPDEAKILPTSPVLLDEHSSIDTWWLYDDGGLNILLPYIISRRGFKSKIPHRIFVLAKETFSEESEAENQIKALLNKYRIEYDSLERIRGISENPSQSSWKLFQDITTPFMADGIGSDANITVEELQRLDAKTSRYLRLRELLIDNSSNTPLIVLSLPLPRKNLVSSALYMAWLEVLSHGMPQVLFVRGSTAAVLAS